jgi:hypothetical protein
LVCRDSLWSSYSTTCYTLGNGEKAKFWQDRWINARWVEEIAQNLLALIPPSKVRAHSVKVSLGLPDKPWVEFDLGLPLQSMELLHSATCYTLGNGEKAKFWQDRWINRRRVEEIAPNLLALIIRARLGPVRLRKVSLLGSGIVDQTWGKQ